MTAAALWRIRPTARPAKPRGVASINQGEFYVKIIKTLAAVAALGIAAMTYSAHAADKGLVGVLMPTKTSQRWINDGDAVKSQLEALGYTVTLTPAA